MAIEFSCLMCGFPLASPGETAGQFVTCPHCGGSSPVASPTKPPVATNRVTEASVALNPVVESTGPTNPGKSVETEQADNPYAPSTIYIQEHAPSYDRSTVGLKHSLLNFKRLWWTTDALLRRHFGPCVLFGLLLVIGYVSLGAIVGAIEVAADASENRKLIATTFFGTKALNVFGQSFLQLASSAYCLKLAREGKSDWNSLSSETGVYWNVFFVNLLLTLISWGLGWGSAFAIAALSAATEMTHATTLYLVIAMTALSVVVLLGVLLNVYLSWFFIVDRRLATIDAMKASAKFMRGNKLTFLCALFALAFGGAFFSLFTFGIGILVVVPFLQLLGAVAYLHTTGQPTSVDSPPSTETD